jgi:FkbM family methyltransferase
MNMLNHNDIPLSIVRGLLGPQRHEIDLRSKDNLTSSLVCNKEQDASSLLILADNAARKEVSTLFDSNPSAHRFALVTNCIMETAEDWNFPHIFLNTAHTGTVLITSPEHGLMKDFVEGLMAHQRLLDVLDGAQSHGGYEVPVQTWLTQAIQPGWRCIDIGSNVGILTIIMAGQAGTYGRVYAFDAFEQNANDVRHTARYFGVDKYVQSYWYAITDGSTPEVTLYSGRHQWSTEWNLSGVDVDGNPSETSVVVPARSLDQMFPTEMIDFIKIDVEGAANGVVKGMQVLLSRCSPMIFFEYHGDQEQEGVQYLRSIGYQFFDLATKLPIDGRELSYHMFAIKRA